MNTNFSLLKSPHIPAMLSFEWRTQGRPLNSFIVGFKTLHFKKYKSYSQMNEGERGGLTRGASDVSRWKARAESISQSCSNPLSSETAAPSSRPGSTHIHVLLTSSELRPYTNTTTRQLENVTLHDNEKTLRLLANKLFNVHS